jgi:hypothetical protein
MKESSVRKKERAAHKEESKVSQRQEREDNRDSRDIQSLIAIVRVRKRAGTSIPGQGRQS